MSKLSTALTSSVGKKVLSGLTGVGLVGFIIVHLIGNLLLFMGADSFNNYAHFLETVGHGFLLPVAEIGLVLLFAVHIVSGLVVARDKAAARPTAYAYTANAGHTSKKTWSSRSMIGTGLLLLVFLVIHILQFRATHLGWSFDANEPVFDLFARVQDVFGNFGWAAYYMVMMVLLGVHLRHGFWSMFQSLGLNNLRTQPVLFTLGVVLGGVVAIGFLILPLFIFYQSGFGHGMSAAGGLR
ncbi:MAG: succinate dehydrogenase cytochrome b subunit [Candidatus Xenobia bacterium]